MSYIFLMRTKRLTAVDLKCMFNSRNQNAKHAKTHEGNTNEPFYYGSTMSISTYCICCTLTRLIGLRRDGICKHCGALNTLQVVFLFTVCSGHVPSLFFHMVESFKQLLSEVLEANGKFAISQSRESSHEQASRGYWKLGIMSSQGKQCHVKVSGKF